MREERCCISAARLTVLYLEAFLGDGGDGAGVLGGRLWSLADSSGKETVGKEAEDKSGLHFEVGY
jgi:hypothetical protein